MSVPASPKVHDLFLRVVRLRGWIVAVFLILTLAGIYGATRIPNDSAIDRLSVAGDPTAVATQEFDRIFPEGDQALIMLESPDPLSLAAVRGAAELEQQVSRIDGVKAHSLIDLFRRSDSSKELTANDVAPLRKFATGTPLF